MLSTKSFSSVFKAVLDSGTAQAVQMCDTLRGSGGYIRMYIFIYMLAYATSLPSVRELAKITGCPEKQVQAVWNVLESRDLIQKDPVSCTYYLTAYCEEMIRRAGGISKDPISECIHLEEEEKEDLKKRFGDRFLRIFHKAARYKAGLIDKGKPIRLSDYGLCEKAAGWVDKEEKGEKIDYDDID